MTLWERLLASLAHAASKRDWWHYEADPELVAEITLSLRYEPITGRLTWLDRQWVRPKINNRYKGKVAGGISHGHMTVGISLKNKHYRIYSHRVAWLLMTGMWPDGEVDHIDGNGLNNKWSNLRNATRAQNCANMGGWKNKPSGLPKGVFWAKDKGKYFTYAGGRSSKRIGYFKTVEETLDAYARASHETFGEYANLGPEDLL